jgi:hypothetical protein
VIGLPLGLRHGDDANGLVLALSDAGGDHFVRIDGDHGHIGGLGHRACMLHDDHDAGGPPLAGAVALLRGACEVFQRFDGGRHPREIIPALVGDAVEPVGVPGAQLGPQGG